MRLTLAQTRWLTAIASTGLLVLPVWVLSRSGDAGLAPVASLFSGWAFSDRPLVIGGALDQPSLHKEFFILCYSLVVLSPCIAVVRWSIGRIGHRVRPVLVLASLFLLVHPFSILTIFAYDVSRYVVRMGVTPMRLVGLALAIGGYVALFLFAGWVSGFHRRKPNDPFGQQAVGTYHCP